MKQTNWYRLDNAAKIYPAVRTKKWSGNFRLSLNFKEAVDPAVVKARYYEAVENVKNAEVYLRALLVKEGLLNE